MNYKVFYMVATRFVRLDENNREDHELIENFIQVDAKDEQDALLVAQKKYPAIAHEFTRAEAS